MFRFFCVRLDDLFSPLKALCQACHKDKETPLAESERPRNPFRQELYRLASERGLTMETPIENPDLQLAMKELTEEAQTLHHFKIAREQAIEDAKRRRRKADCTSQDIKAWWGQSVATWDPEDGKNVDSIEKQSHTRQSIKWFH